MVEKGDSGVDLRYAFTVKIQTEADLGFGGLPVLGRFALFHGGRLLVFVGFATLEKNSDKNSDQGKAENAIDERIGRFLFFFCGQCCFLTFVFSIGLAISR
ncbi:hypothetical protein OAE11_01555, partial [Akkermansiaceae bacterium]|nr:hypothetical protein [Akkermansiaceae bacterium]